MTLLKVQLKLQGLLRKTLKNKNVWSDWKKLIILLLPIFPGLWGFFLGGGSGDGGTRPRWYYFILDCEY